MRVAVAVLAVLLAACGSSAASSGQPQSSPSPAARGARPCGPASARTLAASAVARVYASGGQVYGCSSRAPGAPRRLGQTGSCIRASRVTAVAVAGELAAYGLQQCGVDTGAGTLVVRRLSDGKQLRALSATTAPGRPESYSSVSGVVLRSTGAVAWIGMASSIVSHGSDVEVDAVGASSSTVRLLDRGPGIATGSLRLRGSRLSWKDAGQTRSATLR